MQRPEQGLAVQQSPKPADLVRWPEERVIAKDIRVLTLDDVLDLADRRRRDGADSLEVLWNEQEVVWIDVAVFDEPPRLLGAATGVVRVHKTALAVHEAVQVPA